MIKRALHKFKHNKDGRRLAENFASLTLLQICGYVFPILTFPYLSRVLGVSLFGAIAFASAVIWGIQTIVDWGFNLISARDIARCRDDKERVSHILSLTLSAKLVLMLASALLLGVLCVVVPVFREKTALLWLTFLMIPGHILFPDWFFQGLERMKYITILNFIVKAVFTCLVFAIIKDADDYLWQPVLNAFGFLIAAAAAVYIIFYKWNYRLTAVTLRETMTYIKEGSDVFINTLMPNFYNSFAVMILGFREGNAANGILEGGSKFVTISCNFLQVINRTFFPFLARRIDKHGLFVRMNLACALIVAMVLFVFAPQIVGVFLSPEFSESATVLRILSFTVISVTLSASYGANYLIIRNKERFCRNITIVCSLVGFVCCLVFIYLWGLIGAAIGMFAGRTLLGAGLYAGAKYIDAKQQTA